jgi:hypothetical protein
MNFATSFAVSASISAVNFTGGLQTSDVAHLTSFLLVGERALVITSATVRLWSNATAG